MMGAMPAQRAKSDEESDENVSAENESLLTAQTDEEEMDGPKRKKPRKAAAKSSRRLRRVPTETQVLSRSYVTIGGDEKPPSKSEETPRALPLDLRKRGLEWINARFSAARTYGWTQLETDKALYCFTKLAPM